MNSPKPKPVTAPGERNEPPVPSLRSIVRKSALLNLILVGPGGFAYGDIVHDLCDLSPVEQAEPRELSGDRRDLTPPQRVADEELRSAAHLLDEGIGLAGVDKQSLDDRPSGCKVRAGSVGAPVGIDADLIRTGELAGKGDEYPVLGKAAVQKGGRVKSGPAMRPTLVENDPP